MAQRLRHVGNTNAEPEWRAACERGFDFMIRSQYENGGFPQRFPKPTSNGNDVPELLGMADGARN